MNASERLEAVAAIGRVKARYFRALDEADWPALAAVFTADAVMDMAGAGGRVADDAVIVGGPRIARAVQRFVGDARTVHHGHMPEIDVLNETTATGVWAMEDRIWWPSGETEHGFGHYHDRYARVDGGWLISATKLVRIRPPAAG